MVSLYKSVDRSVVHFTSTANLVVTGANGQVYEANLVGTVAANDSVTVVQGSGGTSFDTDFVADDRIVVFGNSSWAQVRTVVSVTDSDTLNVNSPFTSIDGSGLNYAFVTLSTALAWNVETIHTASVAQVWHGTNSTAGAWIMRRGNTTVNSVIGVFDGTGHVKYAQYGEMLSAASNGQRLYVDLVGANTSGYITVDLRKEYA